MLLNCGVGEDLRVLWTFRRSNQSILRKSVLNINWKDWCWSWNCHTLATWCKEETHLKRPWCWERLKVGGEGDGRGWDGWMVSPTQWIWVWINSRSWWWTGRPSVLWSMGLQRVRHDWVTELNWLIRTGVRWYLIVVLMCISLIITIFILNRNYSSTIYYKYCLFSFVGSWFPSWLYMFEFILSSQFCSIGLLKWQPTPVLVPGKSYGKTLVGYSPWGHKELDTTEQLHFTSYYFDGYSFIV